MSPTSKEISQEMRDLSRQQGDPEISSIFDSIAVALETGKDSEGYLINYSEFGRQVIWANFNLRQRGHIAEADILVSIGEKIIALDTTDGKKGRLFHMGSRQLRRAAIFVSPIVLILLLLYLIFKWNPLSWLGTIGYFLLMLKIFLWLFIKEYRCSYCLANVGRKAQSCHKCGAHFSKSSGVRVEEGEPRDKPFRIKITILAGIITMVVLVIFPSLMLTFPRITQYPVGTLNDTVSTALFNSAGIGYICALIAKKVFFD